MEAREEAASVGRGAVSEPQTAAAGGREAAGESVRRPPSPHAQAAEAFWGRPVRRATGAVPRSSGVVFGQEGAAAASGMGRPDTPRKWGGDKRHLPPGVPEQILTEEQARNGQRRGSAQWVT